LGGEKLNRLSIIAAVFLLCGGFFFYNLTPVSAQSSDGGEGVVPAVPGKISEAEILLDEPVAPDAGTDGIAARSGPTVFTVLRMVLVLVLAAAAIYGVVFFFKRLSRPPAKVNPHLKVLASVPLGPGSFAAVISLGNKAWLVGGADGGVGLISEVADQELVDAMLLDESRRGADSGGFLNFSKILRRLGGAGDTGQRLTPESLRKRRERLKDL
jgi:flagellar protein FliO/FliZ